MNKTFKPKYLAAVLMFFVLPFLSHAQKIPVAKKYASENIIHIDLYEAYKNTKAYPLSTVAESVEYLPLETTDECLLAESLVNIFIDDNEIFVFDFDYCYRFSLEGKFLNKIGKKGRGPGEYNRPTSISVDSVAKNVYFLDSDRLVKYNYNGEFIKDYKLDIKAIRMLDYKEGKFLIDDMYYQYADPGKRFSIRFYSEQEEKQIAKVDCPKKDKIPFSISFPVMYHFNQNTFLKDYWDNTVYKIEDPLNLVAYASINTGKLKFRDKDDNSVFTGEENPGDTWVVDITRISESNRFIFLVTNKGQFIYDKTNNTTFCCSYQRGDNYVSVFENNLTSRPNLFPFSNSQFVNDNLLVTYKFAYEFFEDGVDTGNPKIKKLLQNLQPDDNPVLVLVKLKE